jgi:aryl-alcohol dehydrogenase-like predicted oxidoreductase
MEYRMLGKTGVKVSELCLGTMTFGWTTTREDSVRILDRFVDAGGTFIDSADVYAGGASEEIVGGWLAARQREGLFIATKVRFATGKGPNDIGLSRAHILSAVEASLRRLRTDYIDLYQAHCWDPLTPLEETLEALDSLVRQGKARYIGISNFTGWQLQKAIDVSRARGWAQPVCLQPLYNLLDRGAELEVIPVCRNEGLGVICWSPLRGGWLSGRYRRGMSGPPSGTRVEMAEKRGWGETFRDYNTEHTWELLETVASVAKETGKSEPQVALRWLLQRPGIAAPIIAARTMDHLVDNLGASGWTLSIEQMERLTKAGERALPYPYDLQPIQCRDRGE